MSASPRSTRASPLKVGWLLLRDAVTAFGRDDAPRHGAALAYYALFSVAPLLLLATSIAGLLYDEAAARAEVSAWLNDLVGPQGAGAVEGLLNRALPKGSGVVSTVIGILTTLLGASSVFVQLRGSLNRIWGVHPKPGRGLLVAACGRALGAAMVLVTGALLLASLALGTAVRLGGDALARWVGLDPENLDFTVPLLSFLIVTAAFAAIFKLLPSLRLAWSDVIVGAVITAVLFTIGRAAIGLYLAHTGVSSAYGAAGSLVAFLVWVYASAQILLFGAELTKSWAQHVGSRRGSLPVGRGDERRPGGRREGDHEVVVEAGGEELGQRPRHGGGEREHDDLR